MLDKKARDKRNEHKLITKWYDSYYKIMRNKAYEITNDRELSKDMVHEAFKKIIGKVELIASMGEPERIVYILYIVRSVCIDYLRKYSIETNYMKELTEDDESLAVGNDTKINDYERIELAIDLSSYLKRLKERDAMLIVAKYLWDMSGREIAELVGVKEENVYSYVARAVNRLIKMMEEEK